MTEVERAQANVDQKFEQWHKTKNKKDHKEYLKACSWLQHAYNREDKREAAPEVARMKYMDKDAFNYLNNKWANEQNLMRLVFRIIHLRSKWDEYNEDKHARPADRGYIDRWVKRVAQITPTMFVPDTWTVKDREQVEERNKKALAELRAKAKAMGYSVHKIKETYWLDPVGDCIEKLVKVGWVEELKRDARLNYHGHPYVVTEKAYVSTK